MQSFRSRICLLMTSSNFMPERYYKHRASRYKLWSNVVQAEIPKKPSPPPRAKDRFLLDVKTKVLSENPNSSPAEMKELVDQLWLELNVEDKIPYETALKTENEEYSEALQLYECSLSDEQSASIIAQKARRAEKKPRRELNKLLEQCGKPKRPPMSEYALFLRDSKGTSFKSKQNRLKELRTKWLNLPKEMKDRYKDEHRELHENYRKELKEWEKSIGNNFDKWERIQNSIDRTPEEKLEEPAKPPTAQSLFIRERKAELCPQKVGVKKLDEEWNNLSEDSKKKYIDEAERLYRKYIREKRLWESEIKVKSGEYVQNELMSSTRSTKKS